eukprot:TRINITY_DN105585_c2_g1_i1.p1 TRINITY_DN105585_c2_g1~~TRINITY_DN105585_c2_g1_i1.p1  ORF type:complete len:398 (-),score=20.93 TRINITY_DN105585_c2_g1_i1:3502-4695(-)
MTLCTIRTVEKQMETYLFPRIVSCSIQTFHPTKTIFPYLPFLNKPEKNSVFLSKNQCFIDMADVVKCAPCYGLESNFCLEFAVSSVEAQELCSVKSGGIKDDKPIAVVRFSICYEKWAGLSKEEKRNFLKKISEKIEFNAQLNKKRTRKFSSTYIPCYEHYSRARAQSVDSPFVCITSEACRGISLNYALSLCPPRESCILTENMKKLLGIKVPPLFKRKKWTLAFTINEDGVSMRTFYNNLEKYNPTILVIQDTNGDVFGAFASEQWHRSGHYYGTGESFLFKFDVVFIVGVYKQDAKETLETYRWTGTNDMILYSDDNKIAIGGGYYSRNDKSNRSTIGLLICEDFLTGRTGRCETFDNELLSRSEEFKIANFEVIGLPSFCQNVKVKLIRRDFH